MYFIIIIIIILIISVFYFIFPKKQKQPEKEKIHRCPTKCFDCVNNSQSLNHLNISHGYPIVYAT